MKSQKGRKNNDHDFSNYNSDEFNYIYLGYSSRRNSLPKEDKKELIFDNKLSFTKSVDDLITQYPLTYIKDSSLNILMVAEKPSIARKISEILSKLSPKSNLQNKSTEKGWVCFTFSGKFKGIKANFTVTSVAGHLYESNFRSQYNNWDSVNTGELYDVETIKTRLRENEYIIEKKDKNEKQFDIVEFLKDIAKNQDILCLWLDCDSEGENICYEVIYNVLPNMNVKEYQQIYRALFSSLAEEDVSKAFKDIANYPDNHLSESVDAREIIDLKVGVTFTRLLTQHVYSLIKFYDFGQLNSSLISYGPCQTPTLWFCVQRQREVDNNKTKPYYKIYITVSVNGNEYKIYFDEEYKDIKTVNDIINKVKNRKLSINSYEREQKIIEPPQGLNTANLLKMASTKLKFLPKLIQAFNVLLAIVSLDLKTSPNLVSQFLPSL